MEHDSIIVRQMGLPPVEISLEIRHHFEREPGCVDIGLTRAVSVSLPFEVTVLIRTDGTLVECSIEHCSHRNTYWHFALGSDEACRGRKKWRVGSEGKAIEDGREQPRIPSPTSAQLETLWRLWSGELRPFGLRGSLGGPVGGWAFGGETVDELSARYSGGKPVYLA